MKWGMEPLSSPSYQRNSGWFIGGSKSSKWTPQENKLFENALAVYDKDTPDRWQKVASMIPDKSIQEVISHYKELEADICDIEAGRIAIPGYGSSSFTLEWGNDRGFDGLKPAYAIGGKRGVGRTDQQERKKGVPWTEDEHRRFLIGLKKYGKGDWRNISRNLVITRTPTQVASHAQKYFIRQCSGGKDKRRSSIHDITTFNVTESSPPSTPQSSSLSMQSGTGNVQNTSDQFSMSFVSSQPNDEASFFNPSVHQTHGSSILPTYGLPSYGMKIQAQNYQRGSLDESVGSQNPIFQLQTSHHHHHPRG